MAITNLLAVTNGDANKHFIMRTTGEIIMDLTYLGEFIDDDTNFVDMPNGDMLLLNYQLHGIQVSQDLDVKHTLYTPHDVRDESAFDITSSSPRKFYADNNITSNGIKVVDFDNPTVFSFLLQPWMSTFSTISNIILTTVRGISCLVIVGSISSIPALYCISPDSGEILFKVPLPNDYTEGSVVNEALVIQPGKIIMFGGGDTSSNGVWVLDTTTLTWTTKVSIDAVDNINGILTSGRSGWSRLFHIYQNTLYVMSNNVGAVGFKFYAISALNTSTPISTPTTLGVGDFTFSGKFLRFDDDGITAWAPLPFDNKIAMKVYEYDAGYNIRLQTHVLLVNMTTGTPDQIIFTSPGMHTVDLIVRDLNEITGTITNGSGAMVCLFNKQGRVIARDIANGGGVYSLKCISPNPQRVLVTKTGGSTTVHDNITPTGI